MPYPYVQEPHPQQLKAVRKIYKVKHALVAGDMGVGKTKIAGDFIGNMFWHDKVKHALIICPPEALGVWEEWFQANCPHLKVSFFLRERNPDWNGDVIVTTYDRICPRRKKQKPRISSKEYKIRYYIDRTAVESLGKWKPGIVVIDEGHHIKNPKARRSKAIHQIGEIAEYTIDLTGTPTGNKKMFDLWSQFRFLKADLLEDKYEDFRMKYGIWTGFHGKVLRNTRNTKEFFDIIRPYTIRIKKTGLPEKNFIPITVEMPPEAKLIYKKMKEEFVAYVQGQNVVASIALTKAMKLSQIAGGHIKNDKGEDLPVHTAKIKALEGLLDTLIEQGVTRIVIFARFLWEIERIKETLVRKKWPNIYRVKGRVPPEIVKLYNEEGGAMVCQTKSGSGSNNFQAGNYMIFYSTDYSLINFLQAIDRIHRIGQKLPCFYYFLQSKGTIDKQIYRLLTENKEVADNIKSLMEEI